MFVALTKPASRSRDRFFLLTAYDLQQICVRIYSHWMEKHGWRRPRSPGSFDCRPAVKDLGDFEDNWDLIKNALEAASQWELTRPKD